MKIESAIQQLIIFRRAQNYSEATIKSMASYLKTFEAYLEEKAVDDTKKISFRILYDFQQFVSSLDYEVSSKNQVIYAVRALLKHLNERGHNVRGSSLLRPLRMPVNVPKTINKEDVDKLMLSIDDKRDILVVNLLFWSGLRVGEVHRLNTFDIDLNNRTLRVIGKGNRERLSVYPVHVKTMLKEYLENIRVNYYNCLETQALFLSKKGNRLSIRAIQEMVKFYGQKAGLKDTISPHWLRRSFSTYIINSRPDVNLMILAKYLGHQSINTLKFYTKFEVSELRSLVDQIISPKK